MERLAASYLYICISILLPLLLLKVIKRKRGGGGDNAVRLPPGPWRLPVIGSLHHLVGKPLVHRATADLARRLGAPPLIYLKLGEIPVVVPTSRDAAREITRTHDAAMEHDHQDQHGRRAGPGVRAVRRAVAPAPEARRRGAAQRAAGGS
ncbi:hypothetical protein PR202_gb26579 [Eleusine coracana subsp. coracana]|uniref:Uncharacterized protein n=1 Tax=Eleusine coracana subsp. coracana TaxID=191504 RepID=A0AAV5FT11_ELECO|nr:hypothetical protein PR202_gb26579 [Eleusine coracana subsp. coracana]